MELLDIAWYLGGLVAILIAMFAAMLIVTIRGARNRKKQTVVVGTDPRSGNAILWQGRPDNGRVTVENKDGTFKDLTVDTSFAHPLGDGRLLYTIDLETGVPYRLGRSADERYRRLPPERLYQIRKDTRIQQISAVFQTPWDKIAKYALVGFIVLAVLTVTGIVVAFT